MLIRT